MSDPIPDPAPPHRKDVNSEDYLNSSLTFTSTTLLDADANGVMMSWEIPIMARTASLLAPSPDLQILNIGFGLGIIDRLFAAKNPSAHHIIEAHPDVIAQLHTSKPESMAEKEGQEDVGEDEDNFAFFGLEWIRKGDGRNVLHEGRWQDVVPKLLEQGLVFDVIYFDTFGEDYSQLKAFFTEYVVGLLSPEGRFGFFNGLGADRKVCYDVYCRVVELDLLDAGLDVEWEDVDVQVQDDGGGLAKDGEGEWKGVRRRYWTLDKVSLDLDLKLEFPGIDGLIVSLAGLYIFRIGLIGK
jgi:protein arginine N-methyltransferase 2